jgi:predicted enzyme related to lactoylglutathione lyase
MPAADIARSSDFYRQVFGWNIRKRGDSSIAFDDTTGEVSGSWVLGRPPTPNPGLLFYIMVAGASAPTGCTISPPLATMVSRVAATLSIGLYQQPA